MLTRVNHFFTRKNRYFPGFLRKGLSRLVFASVDRHLKARYPDYEITIFAKLPPIAGEWPSRHDGYQLFAVGDAAYMSRFAKYIATSAVKKSPGACVHLHLIGSTVDAHAELTELRKDAMLADRLT